MDDFLQVEESLHFEHNALELGTRLCATIANRNEEQASIVAERLLPSEIYGEL
jgi:hypothetical protein